MNFECLVIAHRVLTEVIVNLKYNKMETMGPLLYICLKRNWPRKKRENTHTQGSIPKWMEDEAKILTPLNELERE